MLMSHSTLVGNDAPKILSALRCALLLIVLCGGIYPALTVLIGGALFPQQATGSLIRVGGEVVGSELIGQPFVSGRYFYGRPSAAGYKPFAAAGSNLAPSNPALRARVRARAAAISKREGIPMTAIPVDLVAASGSGLDPDISPAAAAIQIPRVAAARNLDEAVVRKLVSAHTESPTFGVLGQPRVNVLQLNLALDTIIANQVAHGVQR